jgi:hypothetical protein
MSRPIFETLGAIPSVINNYWQGDPLTPCGNDNNLECVILANGPSLRESLCSDLSFIIRRPIFCMNDFVTTKHYSELKPHYFMLLDSTYWEEENAVAKNLQEKRKSAHNALLEKTTWPITLFAPGNSKRKNVLDNLSQQNKNIKISYFNSHPVNHGYKRFRHFIYRNNLGMPSAENTLIAEIFIALNIGFKTIYLFGADHSWHETMTVTDSNALCMKQGYHFFDEEKTNLFPIYRDIRTGAPEQIHRFLKSLSLTFEGYILLEEYAESLGRKILNASKKSYIDAFERYRTPSL